jgi:hypothetical protein
MFLDIIHRPVLQWIHASASICAHAVVCIHILSRACVTIDGVLDWILDLLTTYRS